MTTAKDLMQQRVRTIQADTSLIEFERACLDAGVGGFPVVEGDRLVGVISRSDVVRRLVADKTVEEYRSDYYRDISGFAHEPTPLREWAERSGSSLDDLKVRDLMADDPVTLPPDASLEQVARTLCDHHIHRIPITEEGRLAGIVTSLDVVRLVAEREPR